ncbi:MAG: APC family permease [Elusimicrobia bacterium]|nr:APC family permease [Candidatus Obscuribacterium magneticum]
MVERLKELLFGKPKDPLDPGIFHRLSLIALFAWIGLGADGLSSSCYGPEEAFLALGHYKHLAIFLAIAVAATVFILSASYSQIIELFPSGGGGYVVATKLLGSTPGVVSGSALLVDYVLTVAMSTAASVDAIFSFLPPEFSAFKLTATILGLALLIVLNLRGIKESVLVLTPIFAVFVLAHSVLILYGIFSHGSNLQPLIIDTIRETRSGLSEVGLMAMLFIFMRAFALGGGTFTGIEAVSNGLQVLREPRVVTGKKTMFYMALSLAFTAGGILINYLLNGVSHVPGQTLNATLVHRLTDGWPFGNLFFLVTLVSEGALLLVAAQTGFIDGPRVMSNMAIDNWFPRRFKNLSDRLVIKDGILVMGLASLAVLLYSGGSVKILVVLYAINVFLTFSLSQFAMVHHWLKDRQPGWWKKLMVNVLGLVLTLTILLMTSIIKFKEGGWVTLVVTGSLVIFCFWVRRHYRLTTKALRHLDEILSELPFAENLAQPKKQPNQPTAILMVNGYNGMGVHSYLAIHRTFPGHFKNFVFASVGVIDSDRFKGIAEIDNLKLSVEVDLKKYVELAGRTGFYAEYRMGLDTDVTEGLETLCQQIAKEWSRKVFFMGQLVFERESMWTRVLHNQTSYVLQRNLLFSGLEAVILPIRVRLPESLRA